MLIDLSYFVGELNIPNTQEASISSQLGLFIQKYEPEFLERVLGLVLYDALIEGYSQPTPAQKWVDLVQGKKYTVDSWGQTKTKKWKGLVYNTTPVLDAFDVLNSPYVIVGRGEQYDPVAGTTSVELPPELVGKSIRVFQRGFGYLRPRAGEPTPYDEYEISGNMLTLLTGVFSGTDTYFYKVAELAIGTSTGTNKRSLIANYIYYWWFRDGATQTTSAGETITKTENSEPISPDMKMVRAWNEMYVWLCSLVEYLNDNKDTYPEWTEQDQYCMLKEFRPINVFNL